MTDLVVLVPTRSRPQNVAPIAEAWYRTGAFGVADLCFIVDADDMCREEYETEIRKHLQLQCVMMAEWQPLVPKLNRIAVQAAKDYPVVAFMGDDHLPRTQLWAHQLVKEGLMKRPSIVYGQDGLWNERLPTWWSMSSDIIQTLGRMVPAPVQHLFCDNAVKELGEQSKTLVYLESVLVEHMHPVAGKGEYDEQYRRVNRASQYQSDGDLFRDWVRDGLEADATLLRSVGR